MYKFNHKSDPSLTAHPQQQTCLLSELGSAYSNTYQRQYVGEVPSREFMKATEGVIEVSEPTLWDDSHAAY